MARFPMAQKLFEQTFKMPQKFFYSCSVVTLQEETSFVAAEENIDKIWILLLGQVRVLEEYISGEEYIFTRFDAMFGMFGLEERVIIL